MNFAIISDSNVGYYIGGMTKIDNIGNHLFSYSYQYSVGYIMKYKLDGATCLKGGSYSLTTALDISASYTI